MALAPTAAEKRKQMQTLTLLITLSSIYRCHQPLPYTRVATQDNTRANHKHRANIPVNTPVKVLKLPVSRRILRLLLPVQIQIVTLEV